MTVIVTLTQVARNYLAREARGEEKAIFIFQSECLCMGIRPDVFCRSKAEVSPVFLNAYLRRSQTSTASPYSLING